jgi:hypothetical protein
MSRLFSVFLFAFASMAQIQQPPPVSFSAEPAGTGVIQGIVSDANSHEPLKKAQVTLGGPVQTPPTAVTDASGRFVFRQLPAGGYWLSASKSGYNPPHSPFGMDSSAPITLAAGEEKKDVAIPLVPGGSISGHVVDEEGLPVRGCSVTAAQPGYEQGKPSLRGVSGGTGTNDKGEYRIYDLPQGRYYMFARCQAQLPAAHPLMPRGDPRTPQETYLPKFYGGGLDPSTANRLTLAAGANLDSIDFQVSRVPAFTLRGTVTGGDPGALPSSLSIMFVPANRMLRNLMHQGTATDFQKRTFQIRSVIPGAYLLIAFGMHEGHSFYAQRTVEVGAAPPEPLEISLSSGAELKGDIQFDSDDRPPLENSQVSLMLADEPLFMPQPHAEIDKDGAFTLTGVLPGRWRLMVRLPGYVKSVSLGGQPQSPDRLQISPSAAGPLHIMMGTKMAQVDVTVTGASADRPASVLLYPEDLDRLGIGLERISMGSDQVGFGTIPPGHYRLLATDITNAWPILQRPDLLKALEGRTQGIDVPESGRVSATVEVIAREELMRSLEGVE